MNEASPNDPLYRQSNNKSLSPTGKAITAGDLPPADTERWVIRRKAEVVAGVRVGIISLEEACRRYALSVEEFLSWERMLDQHGLAGLRATWRPGIHSEI